METTVQKALHDKLYDRRKGGALEIEKLIREDLASNNHDRIAKVVKQLCKDYAYDVHHPYARTGGLIGLAAASIALGSEVPRYLKEIVPPVLACFADQDARVRYYACESMYNIAKTSKGEILPYFNQIFEALAKLAADSEMSVKNGAELLDRLIKDIISESATSYVSIVHEFDQQKEEGEAADLGGSSQGPTAFSLPRFIPLLKERILVLNPFTRMFLVSWITLLDSIPDLELVSYLPDFLGGLFRFLNDSNQDVVIATQHVLERFLEEIKLVSKVQRGIAESKKSPKEQNAPANKEDKAGKNVAEEPVSEDQVETDVEQMEADSENKTVASNSDSDDDDDDASSNSEDDWVPGQDVHVDHPKILDILVTFLKDASGKDLSSLLHKANAENRVEEHIQLTALRWIDSFFDICPEDMLAFVPRLLNQVLPAMSSDIEQVRLAASRVNSSLMNYIVSLAEEPSQTQLEDAPATSTRPQSMPPPASSINAYNVPNIVDPERRDSTPPNTMTRGNDRASLPGRSRGASPIRFSSTRPGTPTQEPMILDYEAAVAALTLQFLNENEATRVAALSWLLMLQRRAPRKALAAHDGTFPALLKTLSDTSDTVVTRDLQLLSQISKNSDDSYFTFFMVNLLKLFCTDRRLLETRGNLIIRQLCVNLSPERIYRTMADCLEKDEDVEFASIMVQNLNNNLITAPELADLRKKLRTWDSRDSQVLFVTLFRSWCHNAVATISLCLLAQAYEQAYNLLQTFADIEMTVNMLIQIDKLVQLLESPVFTYLRLQLLEPERHPYLYRCLYGILMLLPQSAAFAALKNRLNSVSAIGYLHMPTQSPVPSSTRTSSAAPSGTSAASGGTASGTSSNILPAAFERANRLKPRDEANKPAIPWTELLEKFRNVQDKARRRQQGPSPDDTAVSSFDTAIGSLDGSAIPRPSGPGGERRMLGVPNHDGRPGTRDSILSHSRGQSNASFSSIAKNGRMTPTGGGGGLRGVSPEKRSSMGPPGALGPEKTQNEVGKEHGHRSKFSASHLGRLAIARGKSFSGGVGGVLGGGGGGANSAKK